MSLCFVVCNQSLLEIVEAKMSDELLLLLLLYTFIIIIKCHIECLACVTTFAVWYGYIELSLTMKIKKKQICIYKEYIDYIVLVTTRIISYLNHSNMNAGDDDDDDDVR